MSQVPVKFRKDQELYAVLCGIEMDYANNMVAVLQRHDGEARLVGSDEIARVCQYYEQESHRDKSLSPQRRELLARENFILKEAAGLMNDQRTALFSPAGTVRTPAEAFVVASPVFPKSVERSTAALLRGLMYRGTQP